MVHFWKRGSGGAVCITSHIAVILGKRHGKNEKAPHVYLLEELSLLFVSKWMYILWPLSISCLWPYSIRNFFSFSSILFSSSCIINHRAFYPALKALWKPAVPCQWILMTALPSHIVPKWTSWPLLLNFIVCERIHNLYTFTSFYCYFFKPVFPHC